MVSKEHLSTAKFAKYIHKSGDVKNMKAFLWKLVAVLCRNKKVPSKNNYKQLATGIQGYECCILCHSKTSVLVNENVYQRTGFADGCGQLCEQCFQIMINTPVGK